jgi:DUF1707 SHOCT-like domain
MISNPGIRASDQDREAAVRELREAYAAGRLDLDEVGQRASAAYSARTWGELRELTTDLPAGPGILPWNRIGNDDWPGTGMLYRQIRSLALTRLIPLACLMIAATWASAVSVPFVLLAMLATSVACSAIGCQAASTGRMSGRERSGRRH